MLLFPRSLVGQSAIKNVAPEEVFNGRPALPLGNYRGYQLTSRRLSQGHAPSDLI